MGNISTAVTKKDLAEAIADEFGVQYSPDGKRLLEAPRWGLKIDKVASYTVKPGVLCICDSAFDDCDFPECILLPDGQRDEHWLLCFWWMSVFEKHRNSRQCDAHRRSCF